MMTEEEFRVKMKELGWGDKAIESYVETAKKIEELLGIKVPLEDYVCKYIKIVYD